jgi:hypothetical protein
MDWLKGVKQAFRIFWRELVRDCRRIRGARQLYHVVRYLNRQWFNARLLIIEGRAHVADCQRVKALEDAREIVKRLAELV